MLYEFFYVSGLTRWKIGLCMGRGKEDSVTFALIDVIVLEMFRENSQDLIHSILL